MRWWERTWVGGIVVLVTATSFGVVGDVWPFAAWSMFSTAGPRTSDVVVAVALGREGSAEVHAGRRLPGGYVRDRYQHRFERLDDEGRAADCARMLHALREDDAQVAGVRLERWEWSLVDRRDTPPADIHREELLTCR